MFKLFGEEISNMKELLDVVSHEMEYEDTFIDEDGKIPPVNDLVDLNDLLEGWVSDYDEFEKLLEREGDQFEKIIIEEYDPHAEAKQYYYSTRL